MKKSNKKSSSSDDDEASAIMSKISAITPRNVDDIGKAKLKALKMGGIDKAPVRKLDSIGLGPGISKESNLPPKSKGFVFNLNAQKKKKKTILHAATLKDIPDQFNSPNIEISRPQTPAQLMQTHAKALTPKATTHVNPDGMFGESKSNNSER
jgi:hypothetical protein